MKGYPAEEDYNESINWYSKPLFLHKIVNNMLRATTNPLYLFYIALAFKDLYTAVQQEQLSRVMTDQAEEFVCYRGLEMK